MHAPGDHDLLFGVTALQLRFITQDQLVGATSKLGDGGATDLRQRLCELRMLTADEAAAVATVVQQRLARFGNDARKTLDSLEAFEALQALVAHQATVVQEPAATRDDRFITQGPSAPTAWSYSAQQQRFTVLRVHQHGGLGRVMIARDGELNREIALKEILPALADSEDSRRRFIREAEITGALEHPGVVPVYSLGEFPDGRPYYAMRFIHGVDMRAAIEDFFLKPATRANRRFEFRQLLGRFVAVCQAIHYAHSRGVLHRDIKPANIMLGDFGETLVVDWGLARMMDDLTTSVDLDAAPIKTSERANTTRTQMGRIVGTLPYISPEQAQGRSDLIGPASDIYGLGATLYHLLTGDAPFAPDDEDLIINVVHGRFKPPRAVNKEAPKALEAICLKAMARQRQDRYPTARELALDVERFLSDEHVHAYAEPVLGRTWRWIRHHRTWVMSLMAASIVALAALSTGVALLTAANLRERQAREEATENFHEAVAQRERAENNFQLAQDAVREYYVRVSEETLLNQLGMQPLRNALLQQALSYYEKFLDQRQDDPALRGEVAQAQFFVGRITETIASPERALPHYQQAAKLQQQLLESAKDRDDANADYAQTLNAMGRALQKLGRRDEARIQYQQAADLREKLAKAKPDDIVRAQALASSVMNLGLLALQERKPESALPLLEQAQTLRLAHGDAQQATSPEFLRDLGKGYYNIAQANMDLNDANAAEANLFKAADAFERLAKLDPKDLDIRRNLAICRRRIADAKVAAGDDDAAINFFSQACKELRDLCEHNPDVPEFAADLAGVQMNLGSLLEATGQHEPALAELLAAAEGLRRLVDEQSSVPSYRRDLGVALRAAGEVLHGLDRKEEARARLEESKEVLEQLVKEHPAEAAFGAQLKQTLDALAKLEAI